MAENVIVSCCVSIDGCPGDTRRSGSFLISKSECAVSLCTIRPTHPAIWTEIDHHFHGHAPVLERQSPAMSQRHAELPLSPAPRFTLGGGQSRARESKDMNAFQSPCRRKDKTAPSASKGSAAPSAYGCFCPHSVLRRPLYGPWQSGLPRRCCVCSSTRPLLRWARGTGSNAPPTSLSRGELSAPHLPLPVSLTRQASCISRHRP